ANQNQKLRASLDLHSPEACSQLTHIFRPQLPALTAHMPDNRVSAPNLPPELLIKIQRLALSDMSPLAKLYSDVELLATPYSPLHDVELKPFLKARIFIIQAACSFRYVCRLWSELAKSLLYENIRVDDARLWPSLASALNQPEIAHIVRSLRLSNSQADYNKFVLQHCPKIEVVVYPYPPPGKYFHHVSDIQLPPLLSLKRLYWVDYIQSSSLFRGILTAAINLEHITLYGELRVESGPSLPFVQSLCLALKLDSVHSVLRRTDPALLTQLTVDPASFFSHMFPLRTLPALRLLALEQPVADPHQPIHFPVIIERCPALCELRFKEFSHLQWPQQNQRAAKLVCVRLNCRGPAVWGLQSPSYHAATNGAAVVLTHAAFSALERVILDDTGLGVGGANGGVSASTWTPPTKWNALRAKGCNIEKGVR
ncbi:hypothetical protein K438DRAFT_2096601, partial [Mycena galopus ATCC 62051]